MNNVIKQFQLTIPIVANNVYCCYLTSHVVYHSSGENESTHDDKIIKDINTLFVFMCIRVYNYLPLPS